MNILILEDEQRNADRLIRLLQKIDPTCIISGPMTSVKDTIVYLQTQPSPDLILSDIRLSDGLSFDALKEAVSPVPVIFTTAYDEYAIRAFKYNSFEYLLKPIDKNELAQAIRKVKQYALNTTEDNLHQLIEAMERSNYKYRERFLIPYRDGYKTVSANDISYIFTENKIVRLFLRNGTSEAITISMDDLEKQLNPEYFFRANRQYIVNIDSILFLGNYFGGKLILHLKNYPKEAIVISKDKAPGLKSWIDR